MTARNGPGITFALPARESSKLRSRRLLLEGRVRIVLVVEGRVLARVRGDSGVVHLVEQVHGRWSCTCAAVRPGCAHEQAVWLVVAREAT